MPPMPMWGMRSSLLLPVGDGVEMGEQVARVVDREAMEGEGEMRKPSPTQTVWPLGVDMGDSGAVGGG